MQQWAPAFPAALDLREELHHYIWIKNIIHFDLKLKAVYENAHRMNHWE